MTGVLTKFITILIFIIIIILAILFLDYIFKLTVRSKRKKKIKNLAIQSSEKKSKPLIIFKDNNNGFVYDKKNTLQKEAFTGNIVELVPQMADNSCVLVVLNCLEYVDGSNLENLIYCLKKVSGGDLYICCFEKKSTRAFWDYKLKNIMDKSFYTPENLTINWTPITFLQKKTQSFYFSVFKILPYEFFH